MGDEKDARIIWRTKHSPKKKMYHMTLCPIFHLSNVLEHESIRTES